MNRFCTLPGPAVWRWAIRLVLAWTSLEAWAAPATDAPLPQLAPHPRLLLDSNDVVQLKQRIATAAWARASWNELKADADDTLGRPVDLPPRGGSWSHNYVCPTPSAQLSQGKSVGPWPWERLCPVGHQ